MTGWTVIRYEKFETSPETIEQELRSAVCEKSDRCKENYSIDVCMPVCRYVRVFHNQGALVQAMAYLFMPS